MQYENVFKVIGVVHVILAFLKLLLLLLKVLGRRLLRVLVLGLLRWINVYSRTHGQNNTQHKHTCKQRLTLRNSTTIHKNSEQNWSRTILRVTTIVWT